MIKAILFDLDNTLLRNPTSKFARAYLRLADEHFSRAWGYTEFSRAAMRIVQATNGTGDDPLQTNAALGVTIIAQASGRESAEVVEELQRFYASTYPALQSVIQPITVAPKMIESLKAAGYGVVIATNPIYPLTAICQRLAWGGMVADPDYYSFVSHAGNMHFAKPNPAYYAEILACVGIEPDEAVMVGDNWENDIQAAATLGIHTYHIQPKAHDHTEPTAGTLAAFYDKIVNGNWLDALLPRTHTPEMIEPQFRGNVGALLGLLENIEPRFWTQHPDPDEWSPVQIVCHLLESENMVQRPRLERFVNENNPFLVVPKTPLGPRDFFCDGSGEAMMREFAAVRQQTIHWLRALKPEDWYRPARHSIFGPTTLLEMAHFTAQHDRLHLHQLCQTLGRCN